MSKVRLRPLSSILCLAFSILACQDPRINSLENTGAPVKETGPAADPIIPGPKAPVLPDPIPKTAAPDLFIMSFNVRYNNSGDGVNAWPNRKEQAFTLIKGQNPDLIGFQEVLNNQLTDLKANVTGYTQLGVGRDDGKTAGEFSAIFFRTSRFRTDTSGTFWFSDTPEVPGSKSFGNTITRICTWAHLIDKNTGKGFYHFNLHIDHLSQPSREKSMLLLVKRIGEVKHPAEPLFVTGDFNSGEDNLVIRFMKGKVSLEGKANPMPFLDSFRQYDSISTKVSTRHDFTGNDSADDKIDYIFIQPRMKTLKAEIIRTNVNGLYPSDHFPVTAALTVPDWASTSIRRKD